MWFKLEDYVSIADGTKDILRLDDTRAGMGKKMHQGWVTFFVPSRNGTVDKSEWGSFV